MAHKYSWNKKTERPYRLWNENEKKPVPHRHYIHWQNAHWGAIKEIRWAKVGATIAVVNCVTGRLLSQYTKTVNSIKWKGE